ncbi:MAG: hypothetical protein FGF53_01820 [Candidatus Brockarchaeota archaeon]|nr:hypothetical protein [Candidatus Brockarchaeota archaeon]MBO3808654.1 hypothetical protein [Candidatus Brockarchaeota archaeon]
MGISLKKDTRLRIEGEEYSLKLDPHDPFVTTGLVAAYSNRLAEDFKPIVLDPRGYGSKPSPPRFIAYRLLIDPEKRKLCILYEVYWSRQDCTWRKLNKDHNHDYEQLQIHFDAAAGTMEKVIVSSTGPMEHGGHGVEVFSKTREAKSRRVEYVTSPQGKFPWGGPGGRRNATEIREIPVELLAFEGNRPIVLVVNCYHVFTGLKRTLRPEEKVELKTRLRKLDRKLLEKWYYQHFRDRFGHDVSNPFKEPYVMYYPPPEDGLSRLVYSLLYAYASVKSFFSYPFRMLRAR